MESWSDNAIDTNYQADVNLISVFLSMSNQFTVL